MQRELRQILADQRHHAGIVGPWADLTEVHVITANEEFHAKQAPAAQRLGYLAGNLLAGIDSAASLIG